MSFRKTRGTKALKESTDAHQIQKDSDNVDSPDLSAIDKVSFLEGLQLSDGNPLHSTAMEEDFNVGRKKGKAGKKDLSPTLKTAVQQRIAAVKRKDKVREEENEKKRSKKSMAAGPDNKGGTKKKIGTLQKERGALGEEREKSIQNSMLQKECRATSPATGQLRHPAAKRMNAGPTSSARLVRKQKGRKITESVSGQFSDPQSQKGSEAAAVGQRPNKLLLSDEESGDEDRSWIPGPKKAKVFGVSRSRTSSSGEGSASAQADSKEQRRRRRRRGRQGTTELEVVLDAFQQFCDQYRESVESNAVKQSIESFSSNVRQQLLEKISSYKELRVLKRENTKVASVIKTKTQRLSDAKYELMRMERQALLLQKEKAELELRLADLRRGQALLHDFRELNRQYLDLQHTHPQEKEMYGASSLAALLLETKHVQSASSS